MIEDPRSGITQLNEFKTYCDATTKIYALETVIPNFHSRITSDILIIKREIESAFEFAEHAPYPAPEEAFKGVFADE